MFHQTMLYASQWQDTDLNLNKANIRFMIAQTLFYLTTFYLEVDSYYRGVGTHLMGGGGGGGGGGAGSHVIHPFSPYMVIIE